MKRFLDGRYDRFLISHSDEPEILVPAAMQRQIEFRRKTMDYALLSLLSCLLLLFSFFRSWPFELFGPVASLTAFVAASLSVLFFLFCRWSIAANYPFQEKRQTRRVSFNMWLLSRCSTIAYLSAFSLALIPVCQHLYNDYMSLWEYHTACRSIIHCIGF